MGNFNKNKKCNVNRTYVIGCLVTCNVHAIEMNF